MNNKFRFVLPAVLLALACSCSKNESPSADWEVSYTTIEVLSGDATRTSLDGSSVLWSERDKLKVFSEGSTDGIVFTLANGAGTTGGTFYGVEPASGAGHYFAVYPSTASYNGSTKFTWTMPATVDYVKGTFAPGTSPMLSGTKETFDGNFAMKNLCGVMRLRLRGGFEVSSLELAFDNYVSGEGVAYRGNNTMTMNGSSEADKKITMNCSSPVLLKDNEDTEFYFVLPPAEYDGFTIKATLPDGLSYSSKTVTSSFTISRSAVTTLSGEMPAAVTPTRPELTVWSFNVTCQKNDDNSSWSSSNYWSVRKPGVIAFFNAMQPDIIGTQECEYRQRVNILDGTSGYAAYGLGTDYGQESSGSSGYLWNKKDYNTDSSNAIFYKTAKFDVLDRGTFWLSNNPSSVGSDDGHNCAWIKFRWKENGYVFYVFNTHFTAHDTGHDARLAEAPVLYNQIEAINSEHLPVIITGDFNESYTDLTDAEDGDTRWVNYYSARNQDGKTSKTSYPTSYNGFTTTCSGSPSIYGSGSWSNGHSNIDLILYRYCYENNKHGLKAGTFGTDYRAYSGVTYISDHWPITATFVFDFQ